MANEEAFLIVGLGNPGVEYEKTYHNLGFWVIDALSSAWGAPKAKSKFDSHFAECTRGTKKVFLMKPQTYMNRSGTAVAAAVGFYKLDPSKQLLVVSDDLDLPPGRLRMRASGGTGGHNGLKSIVESLGSEDFPRLRIGIGRHPSMPGDQFVLSAVSKANAPLFNTAVTGSVRAIETLVQDGLARAMDQANRKETTNGA